MRFDAADQTFKKFECLECPECDGKLLRGPRALSHNQNVTCRNCKRRFNLFIVDRQQAGFYKFPESDTDFRNCVAVLGWEYIGIDDAGAAYYDPKCPARECDKCSEEYTGPAVYCCLACALADA